MDSYKVTARWRKQTELDHRKKRWQQAQEVAQQASRYLKKEYGDIEVILFGSTLHPDCFTLTSDIDLAVKGLPAKDFFIAVAKLQDLSFEFKIDLVQLEYSQLSLRQLISEEGKPL